MGNKIKPNWAREHGGGGFLPEPSDDFKKSIQDILNLEGEALAAFSEDSKYILWIYCQRRKEDRAPKHTPRKMEQAAQEIQYHAKALSMMLYGDAGGLRPHIALDVFTALPDKRTSFEELVCLLNGLEEGCSSFLDDSDYQEKTSSPRTKAVFACEVMKLYCKHLNEEPKTTLSLWFEYKSKYTRLLKICFEEAEGFALMPSDGDLKRIMDDAKKMLSPSKKETETGSEASRLIKLINKNF